VFNPFCTAVCAPVVKIEYKFVDPDNIVPPLNVFAERPPVNTLVPDAVTELNEGEAAKFIVGFVAVPPVDKFPFAPTDCTPEPVCAKIEYKFVDPDNIVPPLNVFAERPPVNTLVPDAVIVLTVNAETFTVGFVIVPPVYVFNPFCTYVGTKEPAVKKILYKFVEPDKIVPPLNVFAERPAIKFVTPVTVPPLIFKKLLVVTPALSTAVPAEFSLSNSLFVNPVNMWSVLLLKSCCFL